ncbi:MAG: TFIIB-type zinc ribbon-containing protein [Clostridia bacterium]|nr:TFIIB-type zinc ribbon-containing protein [Clostridia bacterium]
MSDVDMEEQKVVQTDVGAKDGQNSCPKCGSTDISLNVKSGLLRCNFCRHEFEAKKVEGLETDISQLKGEIIGSGSKDINKEAEHMITFKCSTCGAEVVVDTEESTQARCHWCRNTLSVNQQIPNGAVPDVVLPFKVSKNEARQSIENFVGKRKFFAHPKFREEFTTENIMGVYCPYMVVDINAHSHLSGQGEHKVRSYTRGEGENRKTYYDANLYDVERDFDLTIRGLTVESSADKLDKHSNKTNNIINSIMPFDTENSVKWDSNYLKGYSSEKRDVNIDQLRPLVDSQSKDIARFTANSTLKEYDRGVRWDREQLDVKGKQWKSAYLPIWLYSYLEEKGDKSLLHYVAVNARTKETMGSVPIHMPKLFGVSALIELLGLLLVLFVDWDYKWIFLLIGILYFAIMYMRYRNTGARHHHETETDSKMFNLKQKDELVKKMTGLSNSRMEGANNTRVEGSNISQKLMDSIRMK